jgi:glutathione S-transferase
MMRADSGIASQHEKDSNSASRRRPCHGDKDMMQLLYTPNSPYARRVRLAVHEAGLEDKVELIDINPREANINQLLSRNPSGKVPLLVTDEGAALCESLIIARHLDKASGGKLYPGESGALVRTLELEGIASALMDSLFVRSHENRRDAAAQSQAVLELERSRAARCYDALESRAESFADRIDMGTITTLCSLGYADGRHPGDDWRKGRPALTAWYERTMQRQAMAATAPAF